MGQSCRCCTKDEAEFRSDTNYNSNSIQIHKSPKGHKRQANSISLGSGERIDENFKE